MVPSFSLRRGVTRVASMLCLPGRQRQQRTLRRVPKKMLAQLLGMGRKKDPPKDKDSSGGEKEQRRDDALADGGSSLGE